MRRCLSAVLYLACFFFTLKPGLRCHGASHRSPIFASRFVSGFSDFKYAPWVLMSAPMGGWEQEKTSTRRRLFGWCGVVTRGALFAGFESGAEKHKSCQLH